MQTVVKLSQIMQQIRKQNHFSEIAVKIYRLESHVNSLVYVQVAAFDDQKTRFSLPEKINDKSRHFSNITCNNRLKTTIYHMLQIHRQTTKTLSLSFYAKYEIFALTFHWRSHLTTFAHLQNQRYLTFYTTPFSTAAIRKVFNKAQ